MWCFPPSDLGAKDGDINSVDSTTVLGAIMVHVDIPCLVSKPKSYPISPSSTRGTVTGGGGATREYLHNK